MTPLLALLALASAGEPSIGHRGRVTSLAFSPDGRSLASTSSDGTAKVVGLADGHVESVLPLGEGIGEAFAVSWSPDGQRVAVGSTFSRLTLWEPRAARLVTELKGHRSWVQAVAFSPDGASLLSSADDGALELWSVADPTSHEAVKAEPGVRRVSFSPDGKRFAAVGRFEAFIWTSAQRAPTRVRFAEGLQFGLGEVLWRAERVVAAHERGTELVVRDFEGRTVATLKGTQSVRTMAVSPDEKRLACGGNDGTVVVWDLAQAAVVATRSASAAALTALAWSADGKRLAAGDEQGAISVFTPGEATTVLALPAELQPRQVSWPAAGRLVVLASKGVIVDLEQGVVSATLEPELSSLCASARYVFGVSERGEVFTWSLATGALERQAKTGAWRGGARCGSGELAAVFDDRGLWLVGAGGEVTEVVTDAGVVDAAFSSDDRELYVAVRRAGVGMLERWAIAPPGARRVRAQKLAADNLAAPRDGGSLLAEGAPSRGFESVMLLDPATLAVRERRTACRSGGPMASCALTGSAFSPGGERYAVSSVGEGLVIANARSGAEVLRATPGAVFGAAWSPGGKGVAVAGKRGVAIVRVADGAQLRVRLVDQGGKLGLVIDGREVPHAADAGVDDVSAFLGEAR